MSGPLYNLYDTKPNLHSHKLLPNIDEEDSRKEGLIIALLAWF